MKNLKIRITKYGWVEISGKPKYCPFDRGESRCGDWCALFQEPWEKDFVLVKTPNIICLTLCHAQWTCAVKDFTDEREEESNEDY